MTKPIVCRAACNELVWMRLMVGTDTTLTYERPNTCGGTGAMEIHPCLEG